MFRKICFVFFSVFLFCSTAPANVAEKTEFGIEEGLVNAFKTNNPAVIAKKISYPLSRPRPIPAVKDEQDFIDRFDMLFDAPFQAAVANSSPGDWDIVGWRGTMFGNGDIWLDDDGKIRSLNYMTEKEKKYAQELTQKEIRALYPALREFKTSEVVFDISLGRGRIDAISNPNGDDVYRYAFWNKGKNVSEKPDMLIHNGTVEYQGTANNTYYTFKNGRYTYRFEIIYVGNEDMLPYALFVLKDGVKIAAYPADIIR